MTRKTPLVVVLVVVLTSVSAAHGGRYRPTPPSPIPVPGAAKPDPIPPDGLRPPGWNPPTATPRPIEPTPVSSDELAWRTWFLLNRETVLGLAKLRHQRRAGMATGGALPREERRFRETSDRYFRTSLRMVLLDGVLNGTRDIETAAILALGRAGDRKSLDTFAADVRDPKGEAAVREAAALALGMIGDHPKPLHEVLADRASPPRLRAFAALGLGIERRRENVTALLHRSRDDKEDPAVAATAIFAIGLSDASLPPDFLAEALGSAKSDGRLRAHAAAAMGRLRNASGTDPLLAALRDPDVEVRRQAALSLALLPESPTIEKGLAVALEHDDDSLVCGFAALSLGERGAPGSLAPLRSTYRNADRGVVPFAALGLGLLARNTDSEETADRVRVFLRGQLLEQSKPNLAGALAIAVAAARDSASTGRLVELLRNAEDPGLRADAATALGVLGVRSVLADLRALLKEAKDPALVREAANALDLLADRKAIGLLLTVLRDGSTDELRGAAAAALGRLRDDTAATGLHEILGDEAQKKIVRAFAAVGLGLHLERDPPVLSMIGDHVSWTMVSEAIAEVLTFF